MGGITSTLSLCLTYCACTSLSSLCTACFGSTSPGTTGRKRSALLLTLTVALSLFFQYYVAPSIVHKTGWWKLYSSVGVGKWVYESWIDGCDSHGDDEGLVRCAGNAGAYRPAFVAALFFATTAVATKINPSLNREAWPAKYSLFFLLVAASAFVSNAPLFATFFLPLARVAAALFVVIEQVILIDVAYNWNEDWIERSNECDRLEGYGAGRHWLRAIVAACVALYASSLTGIILLYKYFSDGCTGNTVVITLTLVGIVILTAVQLTGTEGSLLTSGVISLYAVYLAFSTVTKNPDSDCNPRLGANDVPGIAIGLTLTAISLAWTGWSWSAESRLNVENIQAAKAMTPAHHPAASRNSDEIDLDAPFINPEDQQTTGIVMDSSSQDANESNRNGAELWKLNVILALISCWVAMSLTGWGSIETAKGEDHTAANPQVGKVNMVMIGISQLIAMILYGWTLVAPRLFPDRDFS